MTSIDGPLDCNRVPAAGTALLGALAIVARHRGIHLSPAQLRRDHRIAADGPAPDELLRLARATGLRAVPARPGFDDLVEMGRAFPPVLDFKTSSTLFSLPPHATPPP